MRVVNGKWIAGVLAVMVTAVVVHATEQGGDADQRIATALEKLVRVQVVGHQLAYEQQNLIRVTDELQAARAVSAQPATPRPDENYFAKLEAEHPRLAAQQRAVFDQKEAAVREAQSKIATLERELTAIRTRIDTHLQALQRIEKPQ
jgi:hypothetical protein